jgi:hypothetical protein
MVNGVLDTIARDVRPKEVTARDRDNGRDNGRQNGRGGDAPQE